jgi:hypothetical protein
MKLKIVKEGVPGLYGYAAIVGAIIEVHDSRTAKEMIESGHGEVVAVKEVEKRETRTKKFKK